METNSIPEIFRRLFIFITWFLGIWLAVVGIAQVVANDEFIGLYAVLGGPLLAFVFHTRIINWIFLKSAILKISKFEKYFLFALVGIHAVFFLGSGIFILIVNYSDTNYETPYSWSPNKWFGNRVQQTRVTDDGRVILRKVIDEEVYYACLNDKNHLRITVQWYTECEPGTAVDASSKRGMGLQYLRCNKNPDTDSTYLWISHYWDKSPKDTGWSFNYGDFSAYPGFSGWDYEEAIRANTLRQTFTTSDEPKIPQKKPEDNLSDSNWSFEKDGITDEIVQEANRISEEIRHYRKGSASDTELCVND